MRTQASERIDLLMKVTGTSNAQLARALSLDASYISRIRSGKRGLPSKLPFVEPASAFFARNVREGYQAKTLARELGIAGDWPADVGDASRLIALWLEGADAVGDEARDQAAREASTQPLGESPQASVPGKETKVRLFFGSEGRREVALAFLDRVAASDVPCELLLQSDEETAWMYEDPSFVGEWARRMACLAKAGCTITVIHTVSRDGNEMWEGVREWLPLYLSGAIRPYYYPRLRDGVRMRSLFVARGRCALVSSSVTGMHDEAMGVMLDDSDAVAALEHEFDAYRALCRPLADMLLPSSADELARLVQNNQGEGAVVAEVSGALVYACVGHGALVVASGKRPIVYRVTEPRLVDAIYGYFASPRDRSW